MTKLLSGDIMLNRNNASLFYWVYINRQFYDNESANKIMLKHGRWLYTEAKFSEFDEDLVRNTFMPFSPFQNV